MVWEQFTPRLQDRLSGAVWSGGLRDKFVALSSAILSAAPDGGCDLTTIYVKFTLTRNVSSPVYAVAWIKNSRKWLVGLAMPPDFACDKLQAQPSAYKYVGLTQCFYLEADDEIPTDLADWAARAFAHVSARSAKVGHCD